jgi:hypothetical protein
VVAHRKDERRNQGRCGCWKEVKTEGKTDEKEEERQERTEGK